MFKRLVLISYFYMTAVEILCLLLVVHNHVEAHFLPSDTGLTEQENHPVR